MNTINAQTYIDQNLTDKSIKEISSPSEKLTDELIIQDYPDLKEINLVNQELTSLTIINCPSLKHLNVRNNQLTKLELNAPDLQELISGGNQLTSLDLSDSPKIKKLIIPDNPYLTKLTGLNLALVNNLNISNTQVSLNQDYEELKQENEKLYEILKKIDEAGQEKKLVLTESIRTFKQSEEAIKRLLEKTEQEWREYFESEDKDIAEKKPLLGLSFQSPDRRRKAKEILTWIIEARVNENYQELVKKWNDGDDYNSAYDFDGSLYMLTQYLRVRNYTKNLEQYEQR